MQHRSDFIWLSHHVIFDSVFLNGQQIHSERKTKKNWTETKTYWSDSTWFLLHLDPILHNDFSCRSESTEKPILAVTDLQRSGVAWSGQEVSSGFTLAARTARSRRALAARPCSQLLQKIYEFIHDNCKKYMNSYMIWIHICMNSYI